MREKKKEKKIRKTKNAKFDDAESPFRSFPAGRRVGYSAFRIAFNASSGRSKRQPIRRDCEIVFRSRVFRYPAPCYFIRLSSATLSYFTYSVVFLHNTKYPTTCPYRQTNPPHHAPAGTKHPLHPPPHPLIPSIYSVVSTSVRDKLGCESNGNRAPFFVE